MNRKILFKTMLFLFELIIIIGLLYIQITKYTEISHYKTEVPRNAILLTYLGNNLNWLIGISSLFFVLNIFIYKFSIKAKRWIIEPIIIIIITLGLTLTVYFWTISKINSKLGNRINKANINNDLMVNLTKNTAAYNTVQIS